MAAPAFATNGHFTHGQGTANKAMAGTGSALPQDPLAAFNNPASVAFLGTQYYFSLAAFNPNRSYTIKGTPTGYPGTFGLQPGTVESDTEFFPMPAIAGNWKLNDASSLAVSFTAHGGMNTDYRTNTIHGGSHTGVDLSQAFLSTTYAHKLGDRHAIGISGIVAVQAFRAQGLAAFSQFSQDATKLTENGHDMSYGVGAKIGYFGQLTDRFSVALSYSPKIAMSEFDDYAGLFAEDGGFDIPESGNIGIAYKATDALTLVADVQQINYSDVASIGNPLFPNMMQAPLGSANGAGFGWDDVTAYKAGFQWVSSPDWTWRAGYSHANQPIPESEALFNILAPGVIEDHVTAGFSKAVRGGNLFNFSLMYALENTVEGPNPMEAPGAQTIELTMDEWEMEFSYTFRF
ncbi:MAG: OmpP1/FadL family transporter [Thermoanaerobaculia bacterium]